MNLNNNNSFLFNFSRKMQSQAVYLFLKEKYLQTYMQIRKRTETFGKFPAQPSVMWSLIK